MTNAVEKIDVQQVPAAITPMDMLNRAVSSGADLDMIEKLMNLQERWEAGNARKAFEHALAAAKGEIPIVIRNATGHNDKKYADFAAIAKAIDPILGRHGLSYRFKTVQTDKAITVTCVLFGHGHSEETALTAGADTSGNKNAIQAIGSTLTYLQRYSLVQMLGLAAAKDDDGNASSEQPYTPPEGSITQRQVDNLIELLEDKGASRKAFLQWAKQKGHAKERLEDIPADHYDACVAAIQAFKKA
jgi:hypothetical protein